MGLPRDNQHGFRPVKYMADATQMLIRLNEELKILDRTTESNRPKTIFIDIKKEYICGNNFILWSILRKASVIPETGRKLRRMSFLTRQTKFPLGKPYEDLEKDAALTCSLQHLPSHGRENCKRDEKTITPTIKASSGKEHQGAYSLPRVEDHSKQQNYSLPTTPL